MYVCMCVYVRFRLAIGWRGQLLSAALFGGRLKYLLFLLLLREISRSLIQFAAFVAARFRRHIQHTLPVTCACMCVRVAEVAQQNCVNCMQHACCAPRYTLVYVSLCAYICCSCWCAACGSNTAFARIYADFNVNFSCAACYDLPLAAWFGCVSTLICLALLVCALPLAVVGGTHVCASIKIAFAGAFN